MLSNDDWKIALDDARKRHEALTALILFTDTQALNLLKLYLTLGIAAASGAFAGLTSLAVIPFAVSCALIGASLLMLIGSFFCFEAMATVNVSLPGRDAEFWLWAAREDVPREEAFRAYLENLIPKSTQNRNTNRETALALNRAKMCAVLTPLAMLLAGAVAIFFRA